MALHVGYYTKFVILILLGMLPILYHFAALQPPIILGQKVHILGLCSSIISIFCVVYLFYSDSWKKTGRQKYFVLGAFLNLAAADFIYGMGFVGSLKDLRFLKYFGEGFFSLFLLCLIGFLSFRNRTSFNTKNLCVVVLVSSGYFALEYTFLLDAYYESKPQLYFAINSTIYALAQAFLFSIAWILLFKITKLADAIFLNCIMLMCIADFAIRFNSLQTASNLPGFEYYWYFSVLLMGLCLLSPGFTRETEPSTGNLRLLLTLCNTAGATIVLLYWLLIGLVDLPNAVQFAHLCISMFIVHLVCYFLAFLVSRTFDEVTRRLVEHRKSVQDTKVRDTISEELRIKSIKDKVGLHEVDSIIQEYNALVQYANTLLIQIAGQAKNAAIASTTQMLAHDVRRPFTNLLAGMQMVKNARSPDQMRKMADLTLRSTNKALVSVNSLVEDILEIGRNKAPTTEPVSAVSLIHQSLLEAFQVHQRGKIEIQYDLQHSLELQVDLEKIKRVFSNILMNSLQAMKSQGTLYISTRDKVSREGRYVEWVLGNDGPTIPKDDQSLLFETFFTSGKKKGTGLGLAIAKKIVLAHGGTMHCHSPGKKMNVEMYFTIPATKEKSGKEREENDLPVTSDELAKLICQSEQFFDSFSGQEAIH